MIVFTGVYVACMLFAWFYEPVFINLCCFGGGSKVVSFEYEYHLGIVQVIFIVLSVIWSRALYVYSGYEAVV